MLPSLFTPQVCQWPALTKAKVPAGGAASRSSLKPQQAIVPSLLNPQVCQLPALTLAKLLAGGAA